MTTKLKKVRDLLYCLSAYDALLKHGAKGELVLKVNEKQKSEKDFSNEEYEVAFDDTDLKDFVKKQADETHKELEKLGVKI